MENRLQKKKGYKMVNFKGTTIKDEEVICVLKIIKEKGVIGMNASKLMKNIQISSSEKDSWEIRISRVSLENLSKHDNSKFTDGNNNGKMIIVPFMGLLK